MSSILSTNIKIFKVKKWHFVFVSKIALVYKISLNGIENHGSAKCGFHPWIQFSKSKKFFRKEDEQLILSCSSYLFSD